MATNFKLQIKNLPEIKAHFQKMPEAMARELDLAIRQTMAKVTEVAIKEAPVNKQPGGGNLRQSITSTMLGRGRGMLTVNSAYGLYVHEGTRPHEIVAKDKKALANRRAGLLFGRKVQHPGTRPNPFIQRTVDAVEDEVQNYFSQAIKRATK